MNRLFGAKSATPKPDLTSAISSVSVVGVGESIQQISVNTRLGRFTHLQSRCQAVGADGGADELPEQARQDARWTGQDGITSQGAQSTAATQAV